MNRQDRDGSNVFEGGFLGLDNIGPIDRSHLPDGWLLEQSDGTGWMGFYALTMAAIASILNNRGRPATDLVLKFLEHFALISEALETQGLWDEADGFFYDRLRLPGRPRGADQGALDRRRAAAARRRRDRRGGRRAGRDGEQARGRAAAGGPSGRRRARRAGGCCSASSA